MNTSSRVFTNFTGRPVFIASRAGKASKASRSLAPKTAAEFHGNHANPRHRNFQHAGQSRTDLVWALGGSVNHQPAVGLNIGHARHGFQETLVDSLGPVHVLHHHVGVLEGPFHVAPVCVQQRADVVAEREPVAFVLFQFRVNRSRVRAHGGQRVNHRRQVLVLDLD